MNKKTMRMTTKTLAYCALLAALSVVLARLIVPMPNAFTRFSIEAVPIFLAGLFFGPVAGGCVGFAADLVGCLFSGFGYNPLLSLPPILYGAFAGLFRRQFGGKVTLPKLLIGFLRAITMRKGVVITGTHFEKSIGNYQIETVRRYIRDHLREPLSVEQLAKEFHYSRTRLSVLFKEATGQTINEYITKERVAKAKHLLVEGKLSMAQISRAVGYSSPQYFSRRFSQMVGCSPSDYMEFTQEE